MEELLRAVEGLSCPSCDHKLGLHEVSNGCQFNRGVRRDMQSGRALEHLGSCGCTGVEPEVIAAIAAVGSARRRQDKVAA
jgi:hypothetical protein